MPRWNGLDSHIGEKFGKLTILECAGVNERGQRLVKCKCDCGKETIKGYSEVSRLKVKSCGCLQKELYESGRAFKSHGLTKSRIYRIYNGMKTRCTNPNRRSYKDYGKRGISVCDEWKNDFMSFYEWAETNGYTDELSLERKDVNKGYSPQNCCWISLKDQANNKRRTVYITYNNEKKPMSVWAKELNISYWTLRSRKSYGWTDKEIIEGK